MLCRIKRWGLAFLRHGVLLIVDYMLVSCDTIN